MENLAKKENYLNLYFNFWIILKTLISVLTPQSYFISAKTNEDKKQAIIYTISTNSNSFWTNFNFEEGFSVIYQPTKDKSPIIFSYGFLYHKLFYFYKTQEFVLSSTYNNCDKYIIVFHRNLTLYYEGILKIKLFQFY